MNKKQWKRAAEQWKFAYEHQNVEKEKLREELIELQDRANRRAMVLGFIDATADLHKQDAVTRGPGRPRGV